MSGPVLFLVGGFLVLISAWIPLFLRGLPLSLPMLALTIGALLALGLGIKDPLLAYSRSAEVIAQFALLMAVFGAGLRIDRPFAFRRWSSAWRLLFIVMPLWIAAAAAMAYVLLGLSFGFAVLLGAVLSPTDPVLAASVQAGPPGAGEGGEAKFALTSEAGANDGLAFPFVSVGLAIISGQMQTGAGIRNWFLVDFCWNVAGGIAIGIGMAAMLVLIDRIVPQGWRLPDTNSGIVSVGLALIAYGLAEHVSANGFIAAFSEAVAIRNLVPRYEYSRHLTHSASQFENLAMVIVLAMLGVALASGLLDKIRWREIIYVLLLFFLRPLAVAVSFIGCKVANLTTRIGLGVFGIRGIASIYYASYLLNTLNVDPAHRLTRTVGLAILISVVLFGTLTDIVSKRLLDHPPREGVE